MVFSTPLGLISFDIPVQCLDGRAHERFGFLLPVLPLGQFEKDAASREQGIGKTLPERAEPVAAVLDISAKSDAVGFPLLADRVDVIDFDRDMLNTLAIFSINSQI